MILPARYHVCPWLPTKSGWICRFSAAPVADVIEKDRPVLGQLATRRTTSVDRLTLASCSAACDHVPVALGRTTGRLGRHRGSCRPLVIILCHGCQYHTPLVRTRRQRHSPARPNHRPEPARHRPAPWRPRGSRRLLAKLSRRPTGILGPDHPSRPSACSASAWLPATASASGPPTALSGSSSSTPPPASAPSWSTSTPPTRPTSWSTSCDQAGVSVLLHAPRFSPDALRAHARQRCPASCPAAAPCR